MPLKRVCELNSSTACIFLPSRRRAGCQNYTSFYFDTCEGASGGSFPELHVISCHRRAVEKILLGTFVAVDTSRETVNERLLYNASLFCDEYRGIGVDPGRFF